jgi:hypothetical protein
MRFLKLLAMVGDILPNISGVMDEDAPMEDRVGDLLEILEFLAEQTETELDDTIIDKIQVLAEQPEFWATLQKVYELFSEDDSNVATKIGALQEDRSMDPATIMLIIEVVGLVLKLWRDRRDG